MFLNIWQISHENICVGEHRCFPVKFVKILGTDFLKEHLRWLLLAITCSIHMLSCFVIPFQKVCTLWWDNNHLVLLVVHPASHIKSPLAWFFYLILTDVAVLKIFEVVSIQSGTLGHLGFHHCYRFWISANTVILQW